MSAQGLPAGPPRGPPPFAPQNASLGGLPSMPDIPPTAVFLALYVVFAALHMKIFRANKARGHKFLFNGAFFVFCMIRIVTMSLRLAWARHTKNVRLGIAAQVFVYVGTIILYIVNWFFAQRVVRAQHPGFGWSKPYRIIFRTSIGCLILSLLLLVVGAIQQFFSLNRRILQMDRDLQLAGQTYQSVFCFAPIAAVALSLIVPRRGTEKFGAGRLKNNIIILLAATLILSIGQMFRMATTWLPPTPLRNDKEQPIKAPWYYSKACFYTFNFTTEFLVIFLYAILRVDLRFYIPDGSCEPGDYSAPSKHKSKQIDTTFSGGVGSEKDINRISRNGSMCSVASNETMHQYAHSLFDDSQTLADSLRYPSTTLEIDAHTGNWKVKRTSKATSISSFGGPSFMAHSNHSQNSQYSAWGSERNTWVGNVAPPVPTLPHPDWPLRESQMPRGQIPVMEHPNRTSRSLRAGSSNSLALGTPDAERGNSVEAAMARLEGTLYTMSPPDYDAITPAPRKHRYSSSPKPVWKQRYSERARSSLDIPPKQEYRRPSFAASSADPPKTCTCSERSYATAQFELSGRAEYTGPAAAGTISPPASSHAGTSASMNTQMAEREFARFSYEAPPRGRSMSESEKDKERK